MNSAKRALRMMVLLGGAALLAGCASERVDGDVTTVGYAWWVPLLFLVACGAMVVVGRAMSKDPNGHYRSYGWGLLAAGPLLALLALPGTLINKVRVSPEDVRISNGFIWLAPRTYEIRFADVARIGLEHKIQRDRYGDKRDDDSLVFTMKDGSIQKVSVETLVRKARPAILARAESRRVATDK